VFVLVDNPLPFSGCEAVRLQAGRLAVFDAASEGGEVTYVIARGP
jgi:hypothetical protein